MAMDFLSRSYEYKKRSHSLEWLLSMLALPIFPGRLQPSIVGRSELNFRVRDGNGWTLALISTNCCIATVLYSNKPLSNCQVVPSGTFKRFAQQNLAAGRIHFARGCSIKRVPARASALVGKRLAVVDVRDDGKISDVLFVHSCCSCLLSARWRRAPNGASKRFAAGKILISCRAGNSSFLRCCGVPASRSA